MPDQLEQNLRDALSHRAAQLDPGSIARLRAVDYHPRRHRIGKLPAIGALTAAGTAAAVAALVTVGSSAAPAFAGWNATPTAPAPGQLAQAAQSCGQDLGNPVLTDSRGPYTAAIYADSTTGDVCLSGNGVSMSSSSSSQAPTSVAAGQIQSNGGGTRDSAGNALTLVDGRTGAGVTAVTIDRSDGSSVQATVSNGWYLAWWPGTVAATNAEVATASGTSTVAFPSAPTLSAPACPSGGHCATGYSFGSGGGTHSDEQSTTAVHSGSAGWPE
ncbi:MAG TPA: hypothetical protein VH081_10540 [Solirubrobacteraceae bacterium]|jgi:hypothetical protein|nr:hypothetical protein [Solirubrobacteraceae bacterium]